MPQLQKRHRLSPHAPAVLLALALGSMWLISGANRPAPVANDAGRASELIAAVNALRASHGLAPYETDPILMSVAANQNDWRVSAGVTTHTGPDGSSPKQRAAAAGYGGGATFFLSENIQDGTGLTPQQAVNFWTQDEPHLNTMLGPNYRQVGAGAGQSGGVWRYTLDAGYVVGGTYNPGSTSGPVSAPPAAGNPVVISTPRPDGSVVHTVEAGQTLWTIAAVYGVDLQALLDLNGLSANSLVHAGDQIVIVPAQTATPSVEPAAATATGVRSSATPVILIFSTPSPQPSTTPSQGIAPQPAGLPLKPGSLALVVGGGLLVLTGALLALKR